MENGPNKWILQTDVITSTGQALLRHLSTQPDPKLLFPTGQEKQLARVWGYLLGWQRIGQALGLSVIFKAITVNDFFQI